MQLEEEIKSVIRDVPNFPKEGIVFKDITPIMLNPLLSDKILSKLVAQYQNKGITKVAGIESRGFLFGYPLAIRLGVPFVLIRKKGRLPYEKLSFDYDLEYGSATIEVHKDAISKGDKVLVHDDLLATGGSASAAAELVKLCEGDVFGFNFLV
ncbi:MAG: adenine phosphoribosyltransferase, partial [Lishizhenia sp.]